MAGALDKRLLQRATATRGFLVAVAATVGPSFGELMMWYLSGCRSTAIPWCWCRVRCPVVLLRVVRHGLASAGRYLQVRVLLTDRPGALANLMLDLAKVGGNVMHVEHVRTGPHLAIDEVEVVAQVETKGHEHCAELLDHLRRQGYVLPDER